MFDNFNPNGLNPTCCLLLFVLLAAVLCNCNNVQNCGGI